MHGKEGFKHNSNNFLLLNEVLVLVVHLLLVGLPDVVLEE